MTELDTTRLFTKLKAVKNFGLTLGQSQKTRWVENVCTIGERPGERAFSGSGASHVGTSFASRERIWLSAFMLFGLAALLFRLGYLQVWRGNEYRALAENNSERVISVPAERGLIYDARGRQLTENVPNFSLTLSPRSLPLRAAERARVVTQLAEVTGEPEAAIWSLVNEYAKYRGASIVLREGIDYETALKIYLASSDLPGINVARGSKRLYAHYELAVSGITTERVFPTTSTPSGLSAVLGYVGKLDKSELERLYAAGYLTSDLVGKVGLEKTYESELRGIYGRRRVEVDARGAEQAVLAESTPVPGSHLELSLDVALQAALEKSLRSSLRDNHRRAAGIALDPRNGKILALVSLPAFDNNDFSGGIEPDQYLKYLQDKDKPLFNRAIAGLYPSGSTVKPALAAAALAEGIINRETTVVSVGGLSVGQWWFPDWLPGGHGVTDVIKSLAWSVNTFYYYIGGGYSSFAGLGADKIGDYLRRFGFGSVLGVDLVGEEAGFIPSPNWKQATKGEAWYIGDTYNLSIGQGDFLVTPLQVAAMTAAIANGGTLYSPRVAVATVNPQTGERAEISPVAIRDKLVSASHLNTVRAGMRACVEYGSCRRLSSLPFAAAGKTGTAQWNSARPNHAWFTSFAPYENPEIVVTILIEEGGEGSATAVPAVEAFYRFWWRYRES